MFFKMITMENGFKLPENTKYKYFHTSMDYLQKIISRFNFRVGREQKRQVTPFMDMVKEPPTSYRQGHYYSQRDKIVNIIREARLEKKKLFVNYDNMSEEERRCIWMQAREIKQSCIAQIEALSTNASVLYLTLKELDNPEYKDVSRYMLEVLFGKPNEAFYLMLKESKEEIFSLEECSDGDLQFYDHKFRKIPITLAQNPYEYSENEGDSEEF